MLPSPADRAVHQDYLAPVPPLLADGERDPKPRVRTLWGELAWQLAGREAYEKVRDDHRSTHPGDVLRQLFNEYGPFLVLIDEWVANAP